MTRAALAALGLAAGCTDYGVALEVAHPPAFADEIVTTRITVYASSSLSCEGVRFGDHTAAQLAIAQTAQFDLGDGGVIARTGAKLVVARGLGADGGVLVAGCAEVGEITGEQAVTITTEAIVSVVVDAGDFTQPFGPQRTIEVQVRDAHDDPVDGRELRWRAYGPAGSFPPEDVALAPYPTCTGGNGPPGAVRIHPQDAPRPGPIAADIQVAWAAAGPARVSGFIAADRVELPAVDGVELPAICTVARRGGRDAVVCFDAPPTVGAPRVPRATVLDGGVAMVEALTPTVVEPIALLAVPSPDADDALYAVTADGRWVGLAGTPDGADADFCEDLGVGCTLGDPATVRLVPACGAQPAYVAVEFRTPVPGDDDQVSFGIFTPTGAPSSLLPLPLRPTEPSVLLGGGCVTGPGGELRQAVVTSVDTALGPSLEAHVSCPRGVCAASWSGSSIAAFTPGPAPRLVGAILAIDGVALVEWTVADADDEVVLVEQARVASILAPRELVAAQVDLDDRADLVSMVDVGIAARVQIALGQTVGADDERLLGLGPALPRQVSREAYHLLAADLDADGVDDLVAYNRDAVVVMPSVEVPSTPIDEIPCP
ncbi:MAG: hypothetical protein R2939_06255 [Kofleriaceae bacterium]